MMPLKPLPEAQQAFDNAHLRTFAHKLPWWFRPAVDRSPWTVTDFIHDILSRITRQFSAEPPVKTLQGRRLLSQHLGYRFAAETVFAKTGYGIEFVLQRMRHLLTHVCDRGNIVIPPDDPLYNKGYGEVGESVCGAPIRIVRASHDDRAAADWLRGCLEKLLQGELAMYCALDRSTHVIKYCLTLRRTLHNIIAPLSDDTDDEQWQEQCMDPIIDEWLRIRGEQCQADIDTLVAQSGFTGDVLNSDVQEVMTRIIRPQVSSADGGRRCLPLLEQIALVLAQRKDAKGLAALGKELNAIMDRFGIAVCDSPAIGLAFLAANALAANIRDFRLRLGPVD